MKKIINKTIFISILFVLFIITTSSSVFAADCPDGSVRRDGLDHSCLAGETLVGGCNICPTCSNVYSCCEVIPPLCNPCQPSCSPYTSNTPSGCSPEISCDMPALTPDSCQMCVSGGAYAPGVLADDPTKVVSGIVGSCGASDGASNLCTAPSSGLCSVGTPTSVTLSGSTYSWSCVGATGACGATPTTLAAATDTCSASLQNPIINNYWGPYVEIGSCSVTCGTGTITTRSTCLAGTSCGNSSVCTVGATRLSSTSCPAVPVCCPVDGTDGTCGSSAGGSYLTPPVSNLCSSGSATAVTTNPTSYTWSCLGTSGSCGGSAGSTSNCSATRNTPPSVTTTTVTDTNNVAIPVDVGTTVNHSCDPRFINDTVRFTVVATDANNDIATIQLRVGGQIYNPTSLVSGTAIFDVVYNNPSPSLTTIETNVTDSMGLSTGWVTFGRSLRVWNCNVAVSGSLYDGSLAPFGLLTDCSGSSAEFTTKVGSSLAYTLTYDSFVPSSALDKIMAVASPDYNQGTEYLRYGVQYQPLFTNVDGQTPKMRVPGIATCQDYLTLDNSIIDPYSASPSLNIDFSSILSQPAWFQVMGGGVVAKNSITDNIPPTCTDACTPVIILNDGSNSAGIVAANSIVKGAGTFSQNNDLNISQNIIGTDYSYRYFYNEYHVKLNQGMLYGNGSDTTDMSTVAAGTGGTGVVFINGNLNINTSNVVAQGSFFMVIVKGTITVNQNVDNISGIFITDNNFSVIGDSSNPLLISGIVYSRNNVELSRGFTSGNDNNTAPSIVVQYRSDFIFSMPGKLTKILSGWREGI